MKENEPKIEFTDRYTRQITALIYLPSLFSLIFLSKLTEMTSPSTLVAVRNFESEAKTRCNHNALISVELMALSMNSET